MRGMSPRRPPQCSATLGSTSDGRSITERVETVVVGAGAAGLAAAARLRGRNVVVIDRSGRIGDSWRHRYDGLQLFTPARHCALPGMPLPLDGQAQPDKHQYADYLEQYAASHISVRLRLGTEVLRHWFRDGRHHLFTTAGMIVADRLIWAAGGNASPVVPPFAHALAPSIRQIHSAEFRSAEELRPGPVLVVGMGQSGVDIARSTVGTHTTYLAGRSTGHVPARLAGNRALHAFYRISVPKGAAGRVLRQEILRRGSPLIWSTARRLADSGVVRLPRVTGVRDGLPLINGEMTPAVTNVLWCTGLRPDLSWLDPRALDLQGSPLHDRGISTVLPRLAFVGLRLQRTLGSGFLAGMIGDANYVISALDKTASGSFTAAL